MRVWHLFALLAVAGSIAAIVADLEALAVLAIVFAAIGLLVPLHWRL